jgi:hypothetical protein
VTAELVAGKNGLDLALDDETPALVVVDEEIGKAPPIGFILPELLVLAWQVLLFDREGGRGDWQIQTQPFDEALEECPILVEADAQGVSEPVLGL